VCQPVFRTWLTWVARTNSTDLFLLLTVLLLALGSAFAGHLAGLSAPLLLTQAMRVGAIEPHVGQPVLLALAATMALGPMLIQRSARFAELVGGASHRIKADAEEAAIREESRDLRDHVILCGCGRVGRPVSLVLEAAKAPYIAVESDLMRFRRAKKSGHKVVFGDAGRKGVLEAAGVARARLVVVTFDRRHAVERILHYAREQNPAVSSIVSAADDQELLPLARAGASTVFPENVAAGLALANQVLLVCGLSQDNAANIVTAVRAELHPELRGRVGR
jgi:CPA2 family monovalent cation:H+ antiporter-2